MAQHLWVVFLGIRYVYGIATDRSENTFNVAKIFSLDSSHFFAFAPLS